MNTFNKFTEEKEMFFTELCKLGVTDRKAQLR